MLEIDQLTVALTFANSGAPDLMASHFPYVNVTNWENVVVSTVMPSSPTYYVNPQLSVLILIANLRVNSP